MFREFTRQSPALLQIRFQGERFLASRSVFPACLIALLLLPQAFSSPRAKTWMNIGLPRVYSGDEPHYLVYVNSLLRDGDLWLENNYAAVHRGSDQAGELASGSALDDHSTWYNSAGVKIRWFDYYDARHWNRDSDGHPVPRLLPSSDPKDAPVHESPRNTPGLAILLAPVLFLARGTPFLEPLALLCSGLATIGALLLFRMLARALSFGSRAINLASAAAFLGTPAWHYSRALFPEAFVLCFLMGASAFVIARRNSAVAGLFMGAAVFVKPVVILAGIPLGVLLLLRRDGKGASLFALASSLFIAATMALNAHLYGAVYRMSNEVPLGDVFHNAVSLWVSPVRGLLVVAPIACFALVGWPALVRSRPELGALLGACAVQFCMNAIYKNWDGGYSFGPRFLVPICPLLCVGLLPILEAPPNQGGPHLKTAAFWIAVASIAGNACAAIQYWRSFAKNPFDGWL